MRAFLLTAFASLHETGDICTAGDIRRPGSVFVRTARVIDPKAREGTGGAMGARGSSGLLFAGRCAGCAVTWCQR